SEAASRSAQRVAIGEACRQLEAAAQYPGTSQRHRQIVGPARGIAVRRAGDRDRAAGLVQVGVEVALPARGLAKPPGVSRGWPLFEEPEGQNYQGAETRERSS